MGIDKSVKDFIRTRWKKCIRNARSLKEAEEANNDPNFGGHSQPFVYPLIVCFDYTNVLKYYPPERVATGHQYFFNWFLPPISEAFNNGASVVYVCLDRGSPANKDLEHKKRYKNSEFMPVPEFSGIDIINDGLIPSPEQWSGFVNNKQLVGDLIYYITQHLLDPQEKSENTFTPPAGKMLALHGGRHIRPNREVFPVLLSHPEVLFVKNELLEEKSNTGIVNLIPKRTVGSMADYPKSHIANLLEGELACLYFAKDYPDDDVLFVSPDGDMLLQLLLMAPDRIDPGTGRFKNNHFLKLRLDGNDDYVNINNLYLSIQNDEVLKLYENPVLTFVAISILLGNDYVHDFCFGVKSMPPEGDLSNMIDNVPVFYQVMFSNARKYRSMFTVDPKIRINMNGNCLVHIDDKLWEDFVNDCYVFKYRKATGKKNDIAAMRVTIEHVRSNLETYKNERVRVIDNKRMRTLGRQTLWVLEYWHNAYRNECLVNPPHAMLGDMSYYGWTVQASGDCLPADDVVRERPEETYDMNKMFKRSWDEFNETNEDPKSAVMSDKRFRISSTLHKSQIKYADRKHISTSTDGLEKKL